MSTHDLFGGVDDPVTEACRMLAEHDLVVAPGSVMRECMNVLHILACDTESVEECLELQALIHHIEAAWAHGMPPNFFMGFGAGVHEGKHLGYRPRE